MDRADRLLPANGKKIEVSEVEPGRVTSNTSPGEDWSEEVLAEDVSILLKKLAGAGRAQDIEPMLAAGFMCAPLAPIVTLEDLSEDLSLGYSDSPGAGLAPADSRQLLEMLRHLGKLRMKVTSVEGGAEEFSTRLHVEADQSESEYTAEWICEWQRFDPPRLLSIRVEEQALVQSGGGLKFVDKTHSVLEGFARFEPQVMRGIEYWSQRITRIGDMAMTGHHGIAAGDVNGDGLEDIYVCDAGSLPNQLFVQQPDGSAKEVAKESGVDWLEDSRSALFVDLDNDGDQDLVVATIAMIVFAENDGAGHFTLRGGFPGAPYPFSMSAADFDSDGDLDIYTCVYGAGDDTTTGKRGFEASSPIPFNDANNGGPNVLLANLGDFRFGDITELVGLDSNNLRWSFAAAWEDIDRDGDPDLYVANDFGRNSLYRNDGGQFIDVAAEMGVEDMAAGMSVAWGDYDRDGVSDLLVGNMFSAAGSRVGYQRNFAAGKQRMARGNSLFSGGETGFTDVSLNTAVTNGGWAWSSAFADLNNDGWEDLVVANGYLTNTRDDDL